MWRVILLVFNIILFQNSFAGVFDLVLKTDAGKKLHLEELNCYQAIVLVFFAPECPLSQNYTQAVNRLCQQADSQNVVIFTVFSGQNYSKNKLEAFKHKYHLQPVSIYDKNYDLAREVDASVTPEAFVIDGKSGNIIYSGAIDDWVISLGKQKKEIRRHYLSDAITSHLNGNTPDITRIKPIGCFLEIR